MFTRCHELCDVLEGKNNHSQQSNPHGLRIEESNALIDGLKRLFNESSAAEQVRLMTIAPSFWGRKKIEKWCVSLHTSRSHFPSYDAMFSTTISLLGSVQLNITLVML